MNHRFSFLFLLIAASVSLEAQQGWQIVPGRITTLWAEKVSPANALPQYPRPQLVRSNWTNLNGLWQYSILPKEQDQIPTTTQGAILVPFAVESALSGVGKTVGKDSLLWYKNTISVNDVKGKTTLLHFGAVDWQCTVWVNGKEVGRHEGGYDPFTFDITSALKKGPKQDIAVRVWDPSSDGPQPRGKQVKNPSGIWYTPVTGIWQTVWLENVPKTYIASTKQTPDVDGKLVKVQAAIEGAQAGDRVMVTAYDGATKIAAQSMAPNEEVSISLSSPRLWSPEHPTLYDLKYTVVRNGKTVDEAASYFAMRKISIAPDKAGVQRLMLNDKFVFQYGPLDQGWWPDGLYTAPTDEALKFDIEQTKAMGFNTIRKHVKVEPARWYRYADELGILVWQDMPSGDLGNKWDPRPGIIGRATDKDRTPESIATYKTEWNEIMQDLHNFPSIVVWVPFNEAWGQFKTKEIVEWTMQKDPSRLVNPASGGNFEMVGHIYDLHNYPEPTMPDATLFGKNMAVVLGEFGGLGLPVDAHTWQTKNNWGYQTFKNSDELTARYAEFMQRLPGLISKGLSAAIYTQTTDVEMETNGMMTYDRKVMKIPVETLKKLHDQLYNPELVTQR